MKYRTEVAGINESTWSSNRLLHESDELAKASLDNLASRWFGFDMSRIATEDTPRNEPIDPTDSRIYQNFRK